MMKKEELKLTQDWDKTVRRENDICYNTIIASVHSIYDYQVRTEL